MAGPVTVVCPLCRRAFAVPCELVADDGGATVLVRMDRAELYGHLRVCDGEQPAREAAREHHPAGKAIERRAEPIPVAPGRRACTLCSTLGAACMTQLRGGQGACCGGCANGNTHPAPQEALPCQTWAAGSPGGLS